MEFGQDQPVAFITGASSGLGAIFARQLAHQGYALVITARRVERLEALGEELRAAYTTPVEIIPADLADRAGLARLEQHIARMPRLDLLVNNAGFGLPGRFYRSALDRQTDMLVVHLVAVQRLTRAALPGMIARKAGAIINVASVAAFYPLLGSALYAATKAALLSFSETLSLELQGTGVKVQALCPGFVRTEFHTTEEYESGVRRKLPDFIWAPAEPAVTASLKALKSGKVVVVPGLLYKILTFIGGNRIFRPLIMLVFRLAARR
ncbi:MAG: SDR family oxidoreductase [Chloroflexi bacterium]|nr:SDR family oxidoreductase [Chloroflexota bacterium]